MATPPNAMNPKVLPIHAKGERRWRHQRGAGGRCDGPRRHHHGGSGATARDADTLTILLDFDFGEAGLVEKLGQLLDKLAVN